MRARGRDSPAPCPDNGADKRPVRSAAAEAIAAWQAVVAKIDEQRSVLIRVAPNSKYSPLRRVDRREDIHALWVEEKGATGATGPTVSA
jgi:hypothetical protein